MAGYIGGNLEQIGTASTKLTEAGTAATDAGTQSQQHAVKLKTEVDDVAKTLATHFETTAGTLKAAIANAKQNLGVATWEGNARQVADGAEATLNGHVEKSLTTAQQSVEALKTQLMTTVQEFQAHIDTNFTAVLNEINTSYGELAKGLTTYSQNLQEVDTNSIKQA